MFRCFTESSAFTYFSFTRPFLPPITHESFLISRELLLPFFPLCGVAGASPPSSSYTTLASAPASNPLKALEPLPFSLPTEGGKRITEEEETTAMKTALPPLPLPLPERARPLKTSYSPPSSSNHHRRRMAFHLAGCCGWWAPPPPHSTCHICQRACWQKYERRGSRVGREKKVFVARERSGGKERRRKPWEKERNVPFSSSKKHF